QYRDAARELTAHGYRVIVPDMPGHGHSEQGPGGPVTDLGDYARFCIRVLDALEVDRPVVVGCSIGVKISLDIGIRMGERARAVRSAPPRSGASATPAPPPPAPTGRTGARAPWSAARSQRRAASSSPACTAARIRTSRTPTSSAGAPTTSSTGCRRSPHPRTW